MEPAAPGQFEALLRVADIALVHVNHRHIVWANPAMHRMFGYEPDELIGKPTRQLYTDPSTYEAFRRDLELALATTGHHSGVTRQVRKDGSAAWFEFHVARMEGEPEGVVAVILNRSDSHELTAELKRVNERYRSVVEDQTEIISRFRPDGTFIFVNEVFCRLFGKTEEELIGRKWQPAAHPDDLPMIESRLREMTPDHPVVVIENRAFIASGELRWMQFVNRGFFESDGRLAEVQAVGRDITDRKRVEQQLAESRQQLELALWGADLGVWDTDLVRGRSTFDARFCAMLGRTPDEIEPSMDGWLALVHPDDLPKVREAMRAHDAGETAAFEVEHRLRHKNGHWVWVLSRGKVARDAAGHAVRATGTHMDISNRKRVAVEGMDLLNKIQGLISGMEVSGSRPAKAQPSVPTDRTRLTGRNREILRLIAEGRTTAQIARSSASPNPRPRRIAAT